MASTIIGAQITIEGEVTSDEDVVVQGTVRGKLAAKDGVVVEQGGVVEADVSGGPITCAGQITGNISSSDRVDLQSGARVVGNVKGTRITIADGAQFKGNVDMDV
jgi:cytoskeletal protein CcmA (bactofilin family)